MCGIVGYFGKKNAVPILIKGLKRLEYRGYDSAGLALINNQRVEYLKMKGGIDNLQRELQNKILKGNPGIGHTRWATHGEPNDINAHPHFDCQKKIAVVHNGIIENYASLKKWLEDRGHKFVSQTDTEVIPHLIEEFFKEKNNFLSALRKALTMIEGAYALCIVTSYEPKKLFAVRSSSPLVLGIIGQNEYLLASDTAPIVEHTKNVIYLDDNEILILSDKGYEIRDVTGRQIEKSVQEILWDLSQIEKGGFSHFMFKEIFEQPEVIRNTMAGRVKEEEIKLGGISNKLNFLLKTPRIVITACGTSWHAGLIGEYLLENLAGIPTEVEYASEFRYKNTPIDLKTAYFVISQSGETADTLETVKKIKKFGGKIFGIVNVVGSSIARETEAGIYLHAGPEIGVASTKSFSAQVAVLIMLALLLGDRKKKINQNFLQEKIRVFKKIPQQMEEILKIDSEIKKLAKKYVQFNNFLYLGRGYNFPVALEGALKLKEISYIHAEGYPAAEMKHGPIALIDKNMPVVVIATDTDNVIYQKVLSNIEEIKARGGNLIILATEGNKEIKKMAKEVIYLPKTLDFLSPLLNIIPLQLLAYHLAVMRGCDVDKPRNLAKSVTVE